MRVLLLLLLVLSYGIFLIYFSLSIRCVEQTQLHRSYDIGVGDDCFAQPLKQSDNNSVERAARIDWTKKKSTHLFIYFERSICSVDSSVQFSQNLHIISLPLSIFFVMSIRNSSHCNRTTQHKQLFVCAIKTFSHTISVN